MQRLSYHDLDPFLELRSSFIRTPFQDLRKSENMTPTNSRKRSNISKGHQLPSCTRRRSGSIDGKALGTHTLGRKSCSDAFKELGESATPYKLFQKTKKTKKGEWVNPRAVETDTIYNELMKKPMPSGEEPDEFQSYYKAVKGFDKRSRFFGTGEKGTEWFDSPYNKGARHSVSSSYNPTVQTQLQQQVRHLTQRNEAERIAREALEAQVCATQEEMSVMRKSWAEMKSSQPPNACQPFPIPHRRDEHGDDGHGGIFYKYVFSTSAFRLVAMMVG